MNNLIDFNHWQGAQIAEQLLSNLQEAKWLQTIHYLNPNFGKDGNQYYYIIGELQSKECIVGFGDTPRQAMINFCTSFEYIN